MDLYLENEIKILSKVVELQDNIFNNNLDQTKENIFSLNELYLATKDQEDKLYDLINSLLEADFLMTVIQEEKGLNSLIYAIENLNMLNINKDLTLLKIEILNYSHLASKGNETQNRIIKNWIETEGIKIFDFYNENSYGDFLFTVKSLLALSFRLKAFNASKIIKQQLDKFLINN